MAAAAVVAVYIGARHCIGDGNVANPAIMVLHYYIGLQNVSRKSACMVSWSCLDDNMVQCQQVITTKCKVQEKRTWPCRSCLVEYVRSACCAARTTNLRQNHLTASTCSGRGPELERNTWGEETTTSSSESTSVGRKMIEE